MTLIYTIRTMSPDDLHVAIDWAASEGWNPGLHDQDCFYVADPQGFLIGELNGEPIATISAVKYGAGFGFIGLYIVKPAYRGKGYGIQIWNAALNYLAGRNIGLDGVVAQQRNYQKSGFRLAYRNIRFAGTSKANLTHSSNLVALADIPFAAIAEYDRAFFPERRDHFLRKWIRQPDSVALGMVENGKVRGYGVIRACRLGYKIGPLNADHFELADELFGALLAKIPAGSTIYLDIPEPNAQALELAQKYLHMVFETARMYTGAFPALSLDKMFGITSFELG